MTWEEFIKQEFGQHILDRVRDRKAILADGTPVLPLRMREEEIQYYVDKARLAGIEGLEWRGKDDPLNKSAHSWELFQNPYKSGDKIGNLLLD